MKILLHTCCGPCTIYPLEKLRKDNHEVHGYFYNPNIHPYTEWQQRKETLLSYAEKNSFKMIVNDNYELENFLRNVVHREQMRCQHCYAMRLRQTARVAKKGKFDAFSTTLLVSPFQNHELIAQIGQNLGAELGIAFYYEDFRVGYQEGTAISRTLNMYRQQYCGCIYSERDRYAVKP